MPPEKLLAWTAAKLTAPCFSPHVGQIAAGA